MTAPRKSNGGGGVATIRVTEEALDRWWRTLDSEVKAEAFSALMMRE